MATYDSYYTADIYNVKRFYQLRETVEFSSSKPCDTDAELHISRDFDYMYVLFYDYSGYRRERAKKVVKKNSNGLYMTYQEHRFYLEIEE